MKLLNIILLLGLLAMFAFMVVPTVSAVSAGGGVNISIETEEFPPMVWLCDSRVVLDDNTEPGRLESTRRHNITHCQNVSSYTICGDELLERINNYAFEGEQIKWDVLVFDKNGIEKISDVFVTLGSTQGEGNDIEVNCILDEVVSDQTEIPKSCNARILEEEIFYFTDNVAAFYTCLFTVETPESMYDEFWVTVEAVDLDGLSGTMDENEFWFFNPVIALSIDGTLAFTDVRPGTSSYSDTLLVTNDADAGSGVLLDMFITGTDFYDSSSSGAKCPTTNQLSLSRFRYYAVNGAYSTATDAENNNGGVVRDVDAEGYLNIEYGIGFNNPLPFYDNAEILQAGPMSGPYYLANILAPGADLAITFRLDLPEPCNGDFDTGSIYFWGEAI